MTVPESLVAAAAAVEAVAAEVAAAGLGDVGPDPRCGAVGADGGTADAVRVADARRGGAAAESEDADATPAFLFIVVSCVALDMERRGAKETREAVGKGIGRRYVREKKGSQRAEGMRRSRGR